ncbi:MAG: transcriptional repressor [Lachnospiraceae bacterium]|nr:transcriptional repressor [Lachnospiraceae bacterium]
MTLKYSRQREAIREFVMSRHDHPTADVVYMNVRREFPNISLGTVYRNLTLLADIGQLTRIRLGDGVDHFDAITEPHYHFVCKECGVVYDLDFPILDTVDSEADTGFEGGRIDGHITYFYGKCKDCLAEG